MQAALKLNTTVLPGHRIEITAPELPEGSNVEVSVSLTSETEQDTLRNRFETLAEQWLRETAMLSSVSQMALHPAYQGIIGMGRDAVPLLLRALEQNPNHWFWALRAITGADPIRPEQRGRMNLMAQAWLEWGRQQGYQW